MNSGVLIKNNNNNHHNNSLCHLKPFILKSTCYEEVLAQFTWTVRHIVMTFMILMVVRRSCVLSRYLLGDQWCVLWRLRSVTNNLLCDYSYFIFHSYVVWVMESNRLLLNILIIENKTSVSKKLKKSYHYQTNIQVFQKI